MVDDIIVWWVDDGRLRRHAQRLQHRPGGGEPSGEPTPPPTARSSPSRARTPGPGRQPCCPRRPPCPASASSGSRGRVPSAWPPAPATPARTDSRSPSRTTWPRPCGRRWPAPAWCRPVWAPATRSGSRPPCPSTATSSGPASPRSRPGSAGSWGGTRVTSGAAPPWPPNATAAWPAASSDSPPRAASRPVRGPPSLADGTPGRDASPAATSRRCSSTASPWPWSTRPSTPPRVGPSSSTSGARSGPPRWWRPRSSRRGSGPPPA